MFKFFKSFDLIYSTASKKGNQLNQLADQEYITDIYVYIYFPATSLWTVAFLNA